ncbi:MAG: hypothetical protein RL557_1046 [archaeon]|jgi:MFS family permease
MRKKELRQIKKAEKTSVVEGSFYGIMDGFGLRYITPYALAMGASNYLIALLSTLPQFLGNISQLFGIQLIKKYPRKNITFYAVLIQTLFWLPLILLGIIYFSFPSSKIAIPWILLIVYSLLIVSGSIGSPAWNSWMKDVVLKNNGSYFGNRNRIINISIVVSMMIAGLILTLFTDGLTLIGFFIIFAVAGIGRFVSAQLLLRQYEPQFKYSNDSYFSFYEFVKKMLYNNFGRFVVLFSLISFATAIAGPFFTVYMLEDVGFSYLQFTICSTGAVISMILFLPRWGRFADKFGNIKVIKLNSILITIIPFLWILTIFMKQFSTNALVFYLLCVELFAGFAWAGFNLSAVNFIYDAVTREKMAFCVAYFNIVNAFGAFVGAMLGGFLSSKNLHFFGIKGLVVLFFISFILRGIITIFIQTSIHEVREVKQFDFKKQISSKIKNGKAMMLRVIG